MKKYTYQHKKSWTYHAKKGNWTTLAKIELVLPKSFVDTVKKLWNVSALFKSSTNSNFYLSTNLI